MSNHTSAAGQPIGPPLPGWTARPRPSRCVLQGRWCRLEPLIPAHGPALFTAHAVDPTGAAFTYLGYEPFADAGEATQWCRRMATGDDPLFWAVWPTSAAGPLGVAALMRIAPEVGTIEVGNINFAPALQRTAAATEAMALLMAYAFDTLGYRRYEWKCDTLNAPSQAAARRLGFQFEGVFRQSVVYKGRSRDTAWFSVVDGEWPALKARFGRWLDPTNFDAAGRQRRRLEAC